MYFLMSITQVIFPEMKQSGFNFSHDKNEIKGSVIFDGVFDDNHLLHNATMFGSVRSLAFRQVGMAHPSWGECFAATSQARTSNYLARAFLVSRTITCITMYVALVILI